MTVRVRATGALRGHTSEAATSAPPRTATPSPTNPVTMPVTMRQHCTRRDVVHVDVMAATAWPDSRHSGVSNQLPGSCRNPAVVPGVHVHLPPDRRLNATSAGTARLATATSNAFAHSVWGEDA